MGKRWFPMLVLLAGAWARGDEGMWTFDRVPTRRILAQYGTAPSPEWLENLRGSAVLFPTGSGAFVSREGLVVTNHHVAREAIEAAGRERRQDFLATGFLAATPGEEIPVPGLKLQALVRMENVTAQVNAAVRPGQDGRQADEARRRKLWALGEALAFRTRLLVLEETFYHGGEYWLYAFDQFQDVRLVAAPEIGLAQVGGQPGRRAPRGLDLDFALFRVYRLGQPYRPPHFLPWARTGVAPGDLVYVAGWPGLTWREKTVAQKRFSREVEFPAELAQKSDRRNALREFAAQSPEHARLIRNPLFTYENATQVAAAAWSGLGDADRLEALRQEETGLRAAVARDPRWQAAAGTSWDRIAAALERLKPTVRARILCNSRGSALLQTALDLVRCVNEEARPPAERLRDYRDPHHLAAVKRALGQAGPAHDPDLEAFLIGKGLEDLDLEMAPGDPLRAETLGGKEPMAVARAAVQGSQVDRQFFRQAMLMDGPRGIARSADPLLRLARALEARDRAILLEQEPLWAEVEDQWNRAAQARHALAPDPDDYPDADGTLRLAYGPVVAEDDPDRPDQGPFPTLGEIFALDHSGASPGWALPRRWREGEDQLDPRIPVTFAQRVDITSGNSGSPVVNVRGECVGVAFGVNNSSLAGRYLYDPGARATSLDARAVTEVLAHLYGGRRLVGELLPDPAGPR